MGDYGSSSDEFLVNLPQGLGEVFESLGDVESSFFHGRVLRSGGLELRVGKRTSVSELDLCFKHGRASSDSPGNDRLGYDTLLHGFNDTILLNTSNLPKEDQDLAPRIGLISVIL